MSRCFCEWIPLNDFTDTLRNAVSAQGCPIRHWHMQMLSGFIQTPVGVQVAGCAQSALAYSVTELVCTHLEKCSFCAGGSFAPPPTQQCLHTFCLGEGEEHQTYCRSASSTLGCCCRARCRTEGPGSGTINCSYRAVGRQGKVQKQLRAGHDQVLPSHGAGTNRGICC